MMFLWNFVLLSVLITSTSGIRYMYRFNNSIHNTKYVSNIATRDVYLRGFKLNFNISFPTVKCCPMMHIYCKETVIQRHGYLPDNYKQMRLFNDLLISTMKLPFNLKTAKCVKTEESGHTVCVGTGRALLTSPRHWNISFLYLESKRQNLDLT